MTASSFVDKLSMKLSPGVSRRGFFTRTALVGAGLAVAPVDYVLKPGTAYAAICNCYGSNCECGSTCCDGYTEFCCTIYGNNQCPAGTLLGGWWKADGTGLCGGPRYYMDCNASCNGCGCAGGGICSGACSGTNCGCANGSCGNRKSGCTMFRYGQCNQGTACVGPIVCRVVTCIPPWQIDGTCSTFTLVDQNTASHDRPCLHSTIGSLDAINDAGGGIRLTGWALDFDTSASINVDVYIDGGGVGRFLANTSRPDIAGAYPGMGTAHGFDITVPISGGTHTVDVYAINAGPGSVNPSIGHRQITVGNPYGSFDTVAGGFQSIRCAGWAKDPDTSGPVQVHAYIDGTFVGEFRADVNRGDVGAHGFDLTLPTSSGTHTVSIYAINVGSGTVNSLIGTRVVDVNPNPIGSLDLAAGGAGGVRVTGWALDPDTPNPVDIHVWVDGVRRSVEAADNPRADIAAAFPGFGTNHGFDITIPVDDGQHTVDVYAINTGRGTVNPLLGRRVVNVSAVPFGNVEAALAQIGQVRVAGWAIDPDTSAPIDVHVYVDGTKRGQGTANLNRPDVGAAYPAAGSKHGFDLTVPVPTNGPHTVHVYGINVASGSNNPLLGTIGVTTGGNPFGSLDVVTPTAGSVKLEGWALDPDSAASTDVHVYVDGVKAAVLAADAPRADIAAAFPNGGPNHGFVVSVPVSSGQHRFDVYAINLGTGTANPLIGTKTVTVP